MPLVNTASTTSPTGSSAATNPSGASGATGAATAASGATGALGGMGSDTFLKLLVAQMRYQNPMSPQDGSQYLAQVSQYAMVEQLQKIAQGQEQVTGYQRALMATSMIGTTVQGTGETGNPLVGTVLRVEYRSGRPALVTTAGTIDLDKIDRAEAAQAAPAQTGPTQTGPTQTGPGQTGPGQTGTGPGSTSTAAGAAVQPSTNPAAGTAAPTPPPATPAPPTNSTDEGK